MTISFEIFDNIFDAFLHFIETKDKQPFSTFRSSKFIDDSENYKYSVYEEARENLGQKWWKPEDIGSGKIQQAVASAIQTRVVHNFRMSDNNLVDWRKKDDFSKRQVSKSLENTLFAFYKSKIKDSDAFQLLLEDGLSYQFIAYLFFIKDSQRFMPISQERFDQIFEIIGVPDFKTSGNASWDNYSTFNDIIKQVRGYLRTKDTNATLLDAHSFLFIIGSPIFQLPPIQPPIPELPILLEEDEESTFPEGKEVFRLHKSKERNRELVFAAKNKRLLTDKSLCCQICGFSFSDKYGNLGNGFIEAHHIFPISDLKEETETKIDDLALVCSNCHRMLHRRRPWVILEALKTLLQ